MTHPSQLLEFLEAPFFTLKKNEEIVFATSLEPDFLGMDYIHLPLLIGKIAKEDSKLQNVWTFEFSDTSALERIAKRPASDMEKKSLKIQFSFKL